MIYPKLFMTRLCSSKSFSRTINPQRSDASSGREERIDHDNGWLIIELLFLTRDKTSVLHLDKYGNDNVKVFHYSVEIASRGFVSKQNKARLKSFTLNCCDASSADLKRLINYCSKASLLTSFSIFQARNEPSWSSPCPLIVRTDHT